MNTRLWLFAAPLFMAASVASAEYAPEEVYFTGAGSSYFSSNNWEVTYIGALDPSYANTGITSVAALTGQDWVATNRLEAEDAVFSYTGPGTGFLLNNLAIASTWSAGQTLEITGYNDGVQVGSTSVYVGRDAQRFDLAWATEIDSFTVHTVGDAIPPGGTYWALGSVNVTAVPEPESYAMLLAGLAIVGAVARRRRAFTHA